MRNILEIAQIKARNYSLDLIIIYFFTLLTHM